MDLDYSTTVPIQLEETSYRPPTRPYSGWRTARTASNVFDEIINDDIPSIVRRSYAAADDVTFRARPNTEYVVERSYERHQPWSRWSSPALPPSVYSETKPEATSYRPKPSLVTAADMPRFDHYGAAGGKKDRPYFLKPELPRFVPSSASGRAEDVPSEISSRLNTGFPFRKYRPNFVPYAPYVNMYDSVKYSPNPDWVSMRPWGYKFRKARFVYVPEEENSSKSMEIERIMREARLRELCKGLYSTSYGDDIMSKVTGALGALDAKSGRGGPVEAAGLVKSAEAEVVPTEGEKERRKPLTLAEKRKRNETLAVGLSRTELLKGDNTVKTSAEKEKTWCPARPMKSEPIPPPRKSKLPPKDPTPPPKEPTPPPKEPTPPPKEPTPPPPKEPTPPPKEPTPPPKEPTPPPKEPTPPPKEPTPPPPKEPTPPPKEPTPPPPKEPTPPPKEPTPPPPKEPTPPPPKEATPSPVVEEPSEEEHANNVENAEVNDSEVEINDNPPELDIGGGVARGPINQEEMTENVMVEEIENGDGEIIRTEYIIKKVSVQQ